MKIIEWILNLLGIKSEKSSEPQAFDIEAAKKATDTPAGVECNLISFSDASYICSMAAKICIGKEVDEDYTTRLSHISRVVGRGHESTIAHSSIIMLIKFAKTDMAKFIELSNAFKFLNFTTVETADDKIAVLVGGSIRAYKYFVRECKDLTNPICQKVIDTLYISAEKEFFEDFIADGVMREDRFAFLPKAKVEMEEAGKLDEKGNMYMEQEAVGTDLIHQAPVRGKTSDVIYSDDPYKILDMVSYYGFTLRDVLKLTSVTLLFHDFSRSTSQQITRHFAAISQESQRYVDYSDAKFINPIQFNSEKYDPSTEYTVKMFGLEHKYTAADLGIEMAGAYPQLIEQGMLKQDARGYLPFNMATKVLMTFTYADWIHFTKERDNKAAQPEVQVMTREANEIMAKHEGSTTLFSLNSIGDLIKLAESPKYALTVVADEDVDEVIGEETIDD